MPTTKTQQLGASGQKSSTNKPKAGKTKSAPKPRTPIVKLDSPIKAGD